MQDLEEEESLGVSFSLPLFRQGNGMPCDSARPRMPFAGVRGSERACRKAVWKDSMAIDIS